MNPCKYNRDSGKAGYRLAARGGNGPALFMDNWICLTLGLSGSDLIGFGHLIGPSPIQSIGNWIILEWALDSPIGPVIV